MTDLALPSPSTDVGQSVSAYERLVPNIERYLTGQLGKGSLAMYERDAAAYVKFAQEQDKVALNWKTLVAWRDYMVNDTSYSPNTINRMVVAVKRVISEALDQELIDEAIALRFSRVKGVKVKALKHRLKKHARTRITKEDMRRLCESPDPDTLLGKRDRAMLATLATSGVRVSELSDLTVEQMRAVDDGYLIEVCGKTDVTNRSAYLSVEAHDLIQVWLDARGGQVTSPYIFTCFAGRGRPDDQPIQECSVWKLIQKYAAKCGLAHIKPHDFRRYFGTRLAKDDIRKAQKGLGHESIESTARHYVLDDLEVGLTDHLY